VRVPALLTRMSIRPRLPYGVINRLKYLIKVSHVHLLAEMTCLPHGFDLSRQASLCVHITQAKCQVCAGMSQGQRNGFT